MVSIIVYGIKKVFVIGRKKCGIVVCNFYLEKFKICLFIEMFDSINFI